MKKLTILILALICANTLSAQETFVVDHITYLVTGENTVKVFAFERDHEGALTIPSTINGYTVTAIGAFAGQGGGNMEEGGPTHEEWYDYHNYVTSLTIPNTVTIIEPFAFQNCTGISELTEIIFEAESQLEYIADQAFAGCQYLTEITIPASVTYVGNLEGSGFVHMYFEEPSSLTEFPKFYGQPLESIEIPEGVTSLPDYCFEDCYSLTSVTFPSTIEYIGYNAFVLQSMNEIMPIQEIICNAEVPPTLGGDIFGPWDGYEEWDYELIDPSAYTYTGILKVPAQSIAAYQEAWGAYFPSIEPEADYVSNTNGEFNINTTWGEDSDIDFTGKTIYIQQDHTITISTELVLDETTTLINDGVLKIQQGGELIDNSTNSVLGIVEVETPELARLQWHLIGAPFNDYKLRALKPADMNLSISQFDYANGRWHDGYGNLSTGIDAGEGFFGFSWDNIPQTFSTIGGDWSDVIGENTETYEINNGDVAFTRDLGENNGAHWMALANPYTFKLDVAKFLSNQGNAIQGGVSYRLNGESWQTVTSGVINVTEGFFVNFVSGGSKTAHFKTSQRSTSSAKASVEREFIRLTMIDGEREIELLFAQNDEANEGYDIFDANKLFSPVEITEPYFVTNNIALVKEEVNTLPYYATMNVRSFDNREVKFKANYIPEGYSLSLIDGEETIDLSDGVEYSANVIAGENADRFKILIKKSLSISETEVLDVNIFNNNRHINVSSLENDLQIEVYNALGQKVFATRDYNFVLNNVPAGAYMIKAFNSQTSKTAKIILK